MICLNYEELLYEAHQLRIDTYERSMTNGIKGLYADNVIWINKNIDTSIEKACVLAEELGHYHTSVGDILDQSDLCNRKQEKMARKWAYNKLITPMNLIDAFEHGCRSRYEIAEFLNVTESFLEDTLSFFREKHGIEIKINHTYTLYLDPLSVYKNFYP